jgi:GTP cyclohydrolase IA
MRHLDEFSSASSSSPSAEKQDLALNDMVANLINSWGEHSDREGLEKTPQRFLNAMKELTSGYALDAKAAVGDGVFKSEGSGLVSVNDIEFFSLCEHHLLPFWGRVSISYFPGEKILGLSKLARLVEVFSRRLQVQERLTNQLALAVIETCGARAVAVQIEAQHMCMAMRGVKKINSNTRTEACFGVDNLGTQEADRLWASLQRRQA